MKNFFKSEAYSSSITRIIDISTTACYLVEGKEKTCLIDTGYGCGSLKDYIYNELNKKVDFVILTHGHLDHCGGVAEFTDVPIYLNSKDIELGNDSNSLENRYRRFKMNSFKKNFRQNIDKKQLLKLKKKRKEEIVNIKKERKIAQKEMKKKFKLEIKNKKIKPEERISNISRKKRMKNEIIILWLILIALAVRVGWIQFGMGTELQAKAYVQQTLNRNINPREEQSMMQLEKLF